MVYVALLRGINVGGNNKVVSVLGYSAFSIGMTTTALFPFRIEGCFY
ncbi:hypothetical protein J2Z66_001501 [Paenibacillus eucommiae]|uniref:DUF1697 domain-containing protein n=1 Tax=Paenibacillus eucommiae TaxID=1355755 RepID=A0ABS4IQP9_9BACL|nr:hypothetical protein [Paenibacillus eucommiae]